MSSLTSVISADSNASEVWLVLFVLLFSGSLVGRGVVLFVTDSRDMCLLAHNDSCSVNDRTFSFSSFPPPVHFSRFVRVSVAVILHMLD